MPDKRKDVEDHKIVGIPNCETWRLWVIMVTYINHLFKSLL